MKLPTKPKEEKESNDHADGLLELSGQHVKMIDDALDSMAHDDNSVNVANDNDVNGKAESETEVWRKWPGLETVHVLSPEEISSHNKYIDNLILMEIENEKREMLLYIDELLDMTANDVIKDVDLKEQVPEEIVVRINNDEFVNGEVLEKYINMKFMDEQGRYSFSHRAILLKSDKQDGVCDVIRIKFLHSKTGKCNRAYIHYIIQAQPLEVEKPKRVKYSDFRLYASKKSSRISLAEVSTTYKFC